MAYEENMAGWQKALKDANLPHQEVKEDRIKDLQRIVESGLPTYDYYFFSLDQFYLGEAKFIFAKYEQVVVRAVPQNSNLSRFTLIGKSEEEVKSILQERILPDKRKDYKIVLNEYDPAEYCGVMISQPDQLIIEMVKEPNLENLCHGHVTPWHGEFKSYPFERYRKMYYINVEATDVREKMWLVVRSICASNESDDCKESNIPDYQPRLGYFEFAISQRDGKLRFIDYKRDH